MTTATKTQYSFQWIALLGLLTALGPLSIDMYMPALPEMAVEFGTTTISISNSIPAYFLGLALGQLFYGSLSDRIGRKPPLYIGLVIYCIGSILCIFAHSEWALIGARVLQALGGCVGVVMARAAIRDSLDVRTSAQALAHMAMILGIAPIIAPLLGSVLIQFFSWHSIFIVLALVGLMGSLQFAVGLFSGVLLSLFAGSVLQNMALTMTIFAIFGLVCVYVMRVRAKRFALAK